MKRWNQDLTRVQLVVHIHLIYFNQETIVILQDLLKLIDLEIVMILVFAQLQILVFYVLRIIHEF